MRLVQLVKEWLREVRSIYYTWKVKCTVGFYENPLKVNGKSSVTGNVILGKNVNFNGMQIVGGGTVKIGHNFHSGSECIMITQFHNFEGEKIPYDSTYVLRDISIGDNVWLGRRVMILGGVVVGEGAIIQAGSVVVTNIPDCAIAGGHPAKVFKYRDRDHYYRLKAQKNFH